MAGLALQLDFSLQQIGLEMGTGAVIGGIIGFAAKKVAKLIAVIVGLELALFKFLETRGILEVNWQAIGGAAKNTTSTATASQPPGWLTSLLSALPVSAGFSGGFLVGFKQG
ncbi:MULTISPECIES: FUN14 domain-containing protein [Haloarcula]|uniref:FUN14 domain-containing protein n=1 Tax=Haloarcula TaxID=2237 RepID=UPI0023E7AEF6|nr:FUN14 domain-containing protein [Halomicroarcula sp. SHR3]